MIFGLGLWELFLLGGLFVALFGLKRFPDAARQVGRFHGLSQRLKRKFGWLSRFF